MDLFYHPIDIHFAKAIIRLCTTKGFDEPSLNHAGEALCRFLSYQTRMGNVCLNMNKLPLPSEQPYIQDSQRVQEEEHSLLQSKEQREWIENSPVVYHVGKDWQKRAKGIQENILPLIFHDSGEERRIYLYRYYDYETKVIQTLQYYHSVGSRNIPEKESSSFDWKHFYSVSSSSGIDNSPNMQKIALVLSIFRPFLIISGGPGTGKTTLIADILKLHQRIFPKNQIALAAPTGKAAARMQDSLARYTKDFSEDFQINSFPVSTLHRLLGMSQDGIHFRYHKNNPLPFDLLILDEASMLDLSLLTKTLEASKRGASLILLGDHNQLTSVETGAVLGDLCARQKTGLSPKMIQKLKPLIKGNWTDSLKDTKKSLLTDSIVILETNYRFSPQSGISQMSSLIRQGKINDCLKYLESPSKKDFFYQNTSSDEETKFLLQKILLDEMRSEKMEVKKKKSLEYMDPESMYNKFLSFRILTPFRKGSLGVYRLNQDVIQFLIASDIVPSRKGLPLFYPILIEQNNYDLELFNGDTGLIIQEGNQKTAWFFGNRNRQIPANLLPHYETCFAMTVHKSQGSEFDHVIIILPSEKSPILTREMIYTAITRSRKKVSLLGSKDVFKESLKCITNRSSGIQEALQNLG